MNILTFDIEDWFHILDHAETNSEARWNGFESRVARNTERLLEMLEARGQKATFFCLGWVAENHPEIVRLIDAAGHEIGSHSHRHQLVYEQTREDFKEDLARSIGALENVTGKKVRSYRAPGFSLVPGLEWVFDSLLAHGIETDSSIFPARRAHGGFPGFGAAEPAVVRWPGGSLREFPINVFRILGANLVFSGGGYFRLLPYGAVAAMMKSSPYVMTYFHPRDFDPDQPVLPGLSRFRRFKSYHGLGSAFGKLQRLLDDFEFTDLRTATRETDWESAKRIELQAGER